ncbi:phage integrase central domain-containing protein [Micromonospora chersina]|uniref:phage integrase central domain-containing protein n=1 Tax=Micromonospora chersina TaxID=47854 RepID=UPI003710709B
MKWRTGGGPDGQWNVETFDFQVDAKRFKALVDANGNQRPTPEQLVEHGFAELLPAGVAAAPSPEPAGQVLTFRAFAEEWLGQLVKPHPETVRKCLERLDKHVFPRLGDRPIAEIMRREMREWQQGLRDGGLSAKTIANIRGESVVPIFKAACRPGEDGEPAVRTSNPMEGLALPEARAERDILESPDETRGPARSTTTPTAKRWMPGRTADAAPVGIAWAGCMRGLGTSVRRYLSRRPALWAMPLCRRPACWLSRQVVQDGVDDLTKGRILRLWIKLMGDTLGGQDIALNEGFSKVIAHLLRCALLHSYEGAGDVAT